MKREKIAEYIENIEQLGADARFENDTNKNTDHLEIIADSIISWCKAIKREIKKEKQKEA